jgi:hypothetical protein
MHCKPAKTPSAKRYLSRMRVIKSPVNNYASAIKITYHNTRTYLKKSNYETEHYVNTIFNFCYRFTVHA